MPHGFGCCAGGAGIAQVRKVILRVGICKWLGRRWMGVFRMEVRTDAQLFCEFLLRGLESAQGDVGG